MLLYAVFTPAGVTDWYRKEKLTFASRESFTKAKTYYKQKGTFKQVLQGFLIKQGVTWATLIRYNPSTRCCEESESVLIRNNTMKDNWHGTHHEIFLVDKAKDEKVIVNREYP